jgi:replicative DNA helicase
MIEKKQTEELEELKQAPFNEEAEQAVIGCLLINNEHINKVGDFLLAEHFYVPIHKRIYEAVIRLNERGMVANPITLKGALIVGQADDEAKEESPYAYMINLVSKAQSVVDIKSYAQVVFNDAIRRSMIGVGEDILTKAYNRQLEATPQEQIEQAEQKLFDLASAGQGDRGHVSVGESVKIALQHIDNARKAGTKVNGIPTGYTMMDNYLGGLQNSDLLILAARPSMGKTSLAVNLGLNAAQDFLRAFEKEKGGESLARMKSVGVFSLEMSAEQLAMRLISLKASISGSLLRKGNVDKDAFYQLSLAAKDLEALPIYIDDTPALSISALRTRARRMKRQHNLSLLIVDYIQLMRGSSAASEKNRVQEIGEISQGLKAIAKELNIPVIALSQLSRAVETRDDKRPQLSDLRESGNIEQDADVVMFIYREEYYLERKKPLENSEKHTEWQEKLNQVRNISEIIIAKQRNGPVGTATLHFNSSTTGFSNLETHYPTGLENGA